MRIGLERPVSYITAYNNIEVDEGALVSDLMEVLNLDSVHPFYLDQAGDRQSSGVVSADSKLVDGQDYRVHSNKTPETEERLSNSNRKYVEFDINAAVNRRKLNVLEGC